MFLIQSIEHKHKTNIDTAWSRSDAELLCEVYRVDANPGTRIVYRSITPRNTGIDGRRI